MQAVSVGTVRSIGLMDVRNPRSRLLPGLPRLELGRAGAEAEVIPQRACSRSANLAGVGDVEQY